MILCGAGFLLSQHATNTANSGQSGSGQKGKRGSGAIPVSVAKVTRGNIGVFINALGAVTPVYTVIVTSRVVGQLMDVRYREGQIVQKGQVLAVIDSRPYNAILTQAEGQLARDQAMLKNASLDLNRYQTVLAQHAIPEQTVATQQALVEQDQGTVKVDEGTLESAQVNVDYATIRSPITGRVGLRTVDPGNIVQANGATGIATITQLQPITVIFNMAEDYIDEVATQMRAGRKLRVDALDRSNETELAQGTVLTVDNQIDATTGTVRVRATFTNRDYKLFPNEFVNARLLVRTLNNVNLIPTAAIQRNNEVAFVYLADPKTQTVHVRNINIATTSGITAAVTGVNPGDMLVTDGFDRLTDGSKVVTRSSPPGGAPAANTTTLGPAEAASNGESQSPSAASATPANSAHKRGAATNAPQAKQQ